MFFSLLISSVAINISGISFCVFVKFLPDFNLDISNIYCVLTIWSLPKLAKDPFVSLLKSESGPYVLLCPELYLPTMPVLELFLSRVCCKMFSVFLAWNLSAVKFLCANLSSFSEGKSPSVFLNCCPWFCHKVFGNVPLTYIAADLVPLKLLLWD